MAKEQEGERVVSNEEDEDDVHLCLRCRRSFNSLDSYVKHRREDKTCKKGNKRQQQSQEEEEGAGHLDQDHQDTSVDGSNVDFFQSLNLQQIKDRQDEEEEDSSNNGKKTQEHQQQHEHDEEQGESSKPERIRRPSADQAAFFMETLGLLVNTANNPSTSKQSLTSPRRDSNSATNLFPTQARMLTSPSRSAGIANRDHDNLTWDENLLLWPVEQHLDFGDESHNHQPHQHEASTSNNSSKSTKGKHPPTLKSFKHQCQHDLLRQQQQILVNFSMMSPSQNEFMRQFELMNVTNVGLDGGEGNGGYQSEKDNHDEEELLDQQDAVQDNEANSSSNVEVRINPTVQEFESRSEPKMKLWQPEEDDEEEEQDLQEQNGSNVHVLLKQDDPHLSGEVDQLGDKADLNGKNFLSRERGKRIRFANRRYAPEDSDEDDLEGPSFSSPKKIKVILPLTKIHQSGGLIHCPTCDSKAPESQFGKHLISHFHLHHSRVPKSHPAFTSLVFQHLSDIIKLSPFRCESCKFYCNWDHEFLRHWREEHDNGYNNDGKGDQYWCSFCSFTCDGASAMTEHLMGDDHGEIVAAITRVVPIVIRRFKGLPCPTSGCDRSFRLKFSLRRHLKRCHGYKVVELEGQEKHNCPHCSYFAFSSRSTASHIFLAHPEIRAKHSCTPCQAEFSTRSSLQTHKRSKEHKEKLKPKTEKAKACDYCKETFADRDSAKQHLLERHPTLLSQCGVCGLRFVSQQELAVHVRKKCQTDNGVRVEGGLRCGHEDSCQFNCDTLNMLLYHRALCHGDRRNKMAGDKLAFPCNLCGAVLASRSNLWYHVKVHGECHRCPDCYRVFDSATKLKHHSVGSHGKGFRSGHIFACGKCDYTCFKKMLLDLHVKRTHFVETECEECGEVFTSFKKYEKHKISHRQGATLRKHFCPEDGCHYAGMTAYDLKSHMLVHKASIKVDLKTCTLCTFTCKRNSELNRHMKNKHSDKDRLNFECSDCQYKTTSKQHLKRHAMAKHGRREDGKEVAILQCRFCDYTCTSTDTLRKHYVRATSNHPAGVQMYNCDFDCDFGTDNLHQFKSHVQKHFSTPFEASSYVESYFKRL